MEQATFAVQSMKDTQQTVVAMKQGVKTMQKEFKKINIDDIEDIQDEMSDMLEMNDEVGGIDFTCVSLIDIVCGRSSMHRNVKYGC